MIYLEIHWKIKVVVFSKMSFVDHLKKCHLLKFVRSVSNHHSSSVFFTTEDLEYADFVLKSILCGLASEGSSWIRKNR